MIIDNAIMHRSGLVVHMMDDPQNTDGLAVLHKLILVMRDRNVVIDLSLIEDELTDQDKNTLLAIESLLREAGHKLAVRTVPDNAPDTLSTLGFTKVVNLEEACI